MSEWTIVSEKIIGWMSEKISDQITFSKVIWSCDPNQEKWVLVMSDETYTNLTSPSFGKQFFGFSLHQVTHGASRDFSKRSSPAIHAAVQLLNKWENTTKEVNNYIHMISWSRFWNSVSHSKVQPYLAWPPILVMAKHLVQLIIAGAQVVGKAFSAAVRQEIRMSQEAAKARSSASKGTPLKPWSAPLGVGKHQI